MQKTLLLNCAIFLALHFRFRRSLRVVVPPIPTKPSMSPFSSGAFFSIIFPPRSKKGCTTSRSEAVAACSSFTKLSLASKSGGISSSSSLRRFTFPMYSALI
eukprot:Trichotokara_eunicae@DN4273_c0_g1_i4.p1